MKKNGFLPVLASVVTAVLIFTALLTGCFSPWAGDEAEISINFIEAGRSILYPGEFNEIEHTLELRGPNGPLPLIAIPKGQSSFRMSLDRGRWTITVEALMNGVPFAQGSAAEDIKPGLNRVSISMNPFDIIKVSSRADLERIGDPAFPDWPLDGDYRMSGNINLGDEPWIPIGELGPGNEFTGTFDGRGYTISGLTIIDRTGRDGLFGVVGFGGMVRNVRLTGVSISGTAGSDNVGAIAGNNDGTIEYCSVYGSGISGRSAIGGLVGYNAGTVRNSYTNIPVSSTSAAGNTANTGGLIGWHSSVDVLEECYALGDVTGLGNYIGGLIGQSTRDIYNSFAAGNVTGGDSVGGLVGLTSSGVISSYALGNVSGNNRVGGLVGDSTGVGANNAALNYTVTATNASAGRVFGMSTAGALSNNHARNGMTVTINSVPETITSDPLANDGANLSLPISQTDWNTAGLNWGFNEGEPWRWDETLGRPFLRNVGPGANRAP